MSKTYKEIENELQGTLPECEEYVKPKENKYLRECKGIKIDVYDVLTAFEVTNPAYAHAIKKILAPGKRGHKDSTQDINEAIESLKRGLEL